MMFLPQSRRHVGRVPSGTERVSRLERAVHRQDLGGGGTS